MLIRITQNDIDKGWKLQKRAMVNTFYTLCNPISWAIQRMWNGEPRVDFVMDRVFIDCSLSHLPQSSISCRIEMPQEVRDWFRRFMKSGDVEPISFVVVQESMR